MTKYEVGPVSVRSGPHRVPEAIKSTLEIELEGKSECIWQEIDALAFNLKNDVANLAAMTQEVHAP